MLSVISFAASLKVVRSSAQMAPLVGSQSQRLQLIDHRVVHVPLAFEAQRFMARLYSPILMSIAVASLTFRLLLPE